MYRVYASTIVHRKSVALAISEQVDKVGQSEGFLQHYAPVVVNTLNIVKLNPLDSRRETDGNVKYLISTRRTARCRFNTNRKHRKFLSSCNFNAIVTGRLPLNQQRKESVAQYLRTSIQFHIWIILRVYAKAPPIDSFYREERISVCILWTVFGKPSQSKEAQFDKTSRCFLTQIHEVRVYRLQTTFCMSLERHAVVHTQERPFVCAVCGDEYSRNDTLKSHRRAKHKEQQVAKATGLPGEHSAFKN
ncbi:hypothetical protein CLF_107841 [Clonorchis sinensis]|uniref:C2H2-type domain-containing protein n=1 Tax=Clonorchis sinensis TaxID=79923 RepID=H2KU57_CLOSI|nr:hypothetical protein CLF_107841 [Clonorchis sinensis]